MDIYFATSNKHKFKEVSEILKQSGISVKHLPFKHRELRSDSLEEISREAVAAAYKQCREPVFVEDTGLFIDALNGFPGSFSAWTLEKIGLQGIMQLMEHQTDRHAHFETVIGFKKDASHISLFRGKCEGRIATTERGEEGFGYDPIFIPEGEHQTFAESITLKNKLSHRYKSLLEFSKVLTTRR